MDDTICFWIPLQPVPMSRPRFTRSGHAYTAAATQKAIGEMVGALAENVPPVPFTKPVHVYFDAYLKTPKKDLTAVRRMRHEYMTPYHSKKPDLDNLTKFLLDCMTKAGFWEDDGIVSKIRASKILCGDGEPGWDVCVETAQD